MEKRKVRGLVHCCCQEGYRAQVPQHSIDSYRYMSTWRIFILIWIMKILLNTRAMISTKQDL